MATNLDLVNRALLELGNARVLTQAELDAADTSPAKVMAAAYPSAISDVVSRFDFYTTRKVSRLTSTGTPTDTEFEYSFDIPSDLASFRKLTTTEGYRLDHRLDGTKILANESTIFLHYNVKVTDISTVPDYVFTPTVFWLAHIVAKPITGELSDRDRMHQYYKEAYAHAKTKASQEAAPGFIKNASNSTFLAAHDGYGDV